MITNKLNNNRLNVIVQTIKVKTMKKHLLLLLALVATLMMASCTKGNYYVKYEVSAPSSHFYGGGTMTLNLNTESGMQNITNSNSMYSGTFGPVSKGFEASISASVNYPSNIRTSIYVSKGQEPFVLKASGTSSAQYVIDF